MERVRYKPKIGEICIYAGMKSIIGQTVKCINIKDEYRVWIVGYNTGTRYDIKAWSCSTRFLAPYQPPEPDWEV